MSKNKNKFNNEAIGAIPGTVTLEKAMEAHAQLSEPEDGRAFLVLPEGSELPAAGQYVTTINDDGEIESIEPWSQEAKPLLPIAQPDIVVFCNDKNKKCVATFRVKRKETGEVKYVCTDCVGPAFENEYQVML